MDIVFLTDIKNKIESKTTVSTFHFGKKIFIIGVKTLTTPTVIVNVTNRI